LGFCRDFNSGIAVGITVPVHLTLPLSLSIGGLDPLIQTSPKEPNLNHAVSDSVGLSVQVPPLRIPDCGLDWISGTRPPMEEKQNNA
jgi:hypothetical protein